MKKRILNFIKGLGSPINIFPSQHNRIKSYDCNKTVSKSLYDDWVMVWNDLSKIIDHYNRNFKK